MVRWPNDAVGDGALTHELPRPTRVGRGFLDYDFGDHPLNPVRLDLTDPRWPATRRAGRRSTSSRRGRPTSEQLLTVHDADYLDAVRAASADPTFSGYGLGTDDDPVFAGMYEASALIAGGSAGRADRCGTGAVEHAVNIAGGLHHAMRGYAVGILRLQRRRCSASARCSAGGAQRVAYVDIDVHHGDGVQAAFYDDPRVLTISLHQDPRTLFPGTGLPTEIGAGAAEGTAVNVALPPGTDDAGWLRAFHAVVPGAVRAFAPDVLVTQCGCDTHHEDPLANLELTVDGQRAGDRRRCTSWRTRSPAAVARLRRRRLRPGALRAAHLDAPARRGQRPARSTRRRRSRRRGPTTCASAACAATCRERMGEGRGRPVGRAVGARRRHLAGPGDRRHPAAPRSRCSASTRTTPVTDRRHGPPSRPRTGRPTSSSPTAARCTCARSARRTPTRSSRSTAALSTRTRYLRYFSAYPRIPERDLLPVHPRRPPRPGRVRRRARRRDHRGRPVRARRRAPTRPRSPSSSPTRTRAAASARCCSSTSPPPRRERGHRRGSSPSCSPRTSAMMRVFRDAGYEIEPAPRGRRGAPRVRRSTRPR